jgi:guanylate kinase
MEQRVVITLDPEDLQELERILMDREEKDALRYLRERIEKKVKKVSKAHCRPPFD